MAHHLHDAGPDSIERGKARFEKRFGVDLEVEISKFNAVYDIQWESALGACPIYQSAIFPTSTEVGQDVSG